MDRFYISAKAIKMSGSREIQQDAYMVSDKKLYAKKGFLVVLSDGIGGMQAGDIYSDIATRGMIEAFEQNTVPYDMCTELLYDYAQARRRAMEWRTGPGGAAGGATVVAVLIREKYCAFLSVGDSKLYLLRNGGLIRLNRDQKLGVSLDELAALGYVPDMEAKLNVYRESLTNHFGETEVRSIDRCLDPFRLAAGDKLVLVSDGVTGALSEQKLKRLLMLPGTTGASAVISEIKKLNAPRQDNSSIMVLALSESSGAAKTRRYGNGR